MKLFSDQNSNERIETMKKRIVALSLASIIALGSLSMSACNKKKAEENAGEGGLEIDIEIPRLDGGGEDFNFFLSYGVFDADYIVEEETGDRIKDIIYQRNKTVEDYFNTKLVFRPGNKTSNSADTQLIRNFILSGDDTYDVYINVQHAGVPLIYEGLFVDWMEYMPHNDLSQSWWYGNVQRDLNFSDKVYVTAGAYNFHCLKSAGVLAFNKTMMDELEMEYPYEMVKNGTWTIDKFIEMVKKGQEDLNGDAKLSFENDRFGFSGWKWEMMPAIYVGMGGENVTKDESNLPVLSVNNQRNIQVLDKMIALFSSSGGAWDGGNTYGVANTMFNEERLLFKDSTLGALEGLRNVEFDFGAVPYPKLDEEQENYYSRVVNFSSLTYIPVTNANLEFTSAVLEAMAYLSDKYLIPEFYDVILTVKTARDTETEEMIDIVRNGARFMNEDYLSSGKIIEIATNGPTNTFSSYYMSNRDTWQIKFNTLMQFWTN